MHKTKENHAATDKAWFVLDWGLRIGVSAGFLIR